MRSRRQWTMRLFPIPSAFTHSFSPSNPLFLLHICQVHGFQGGIAEHILKFRAKSERCRDSGRAARVTWAPVVSGRAFSTFVTFYPKNQPTTYSRSCTSKIHYLYLCPPSPPPLNHRGHCWVGVGVKYNSKSPPPCHHLLTIFIVPSLSLSRNGGNENCLQSRNSRWCPLLQLQPSQHQQCCYKFYFGGEADCVFET